MEPLKIVNGVKIAPKVTFKDLPIGAVFNFDADNTATLYMKSREVLLKEASWNSNAFGLSYNVVGHSYWMYPEREVIPYDATLTIEKCNV